MFGFVLTFFFLVLFGFKLKFKSGNPCFNSQHHMVISTCILLKPEVHVVREKGSLSQKFVSVINKEKRCCKRL